MGDTRQETARWEPRGVLGRITFTEMSHMTDLAIISEVIKHPPSIVLVSTQGKIDVDQSAKGSMSSHVDSKCGKTFPAR